MIHISLAATDDQIARSHPVMHQLRPHVPAEGYVERVRRMEEGGFRLAILENGGVVEAAAGFRIMEQLASGRVLYVDDLVTDDAARSRGNGEALLAWLREQARAAECEYLELDSGVWRGGAHRFYFRHGLTILGYHFRTEPLRPGPAAASA